MEEHFKELLDRYQYSEETRELAAFRIIFGGDDIKEVMQDLSIHSIHTITNWVAAYRRKIEQGIGIFTTNDREAKTKCRSS